MIKKLKVKFVILSALSLLTLLTLIITGMNILNYRSVVAEADEILSLISQNKGEFPELDPGQDVGPAGVIGGGGRGDRFRLELSPELQYESRYFSVLFASDGELLRVDTTRIVSIDGTAAVEFAREVLEKSGDWGFLGSFRYTRTTEGDATRLTFLDCGRKLDAFRNFLTISILMAAAGFIVILLIISFFAGRIIRPIAESYEKQKRFITDAGHEIKTPLTIISANTDVLEMDIGKNECLEDIRQQAKRLTGLTNDLVFLARMEEAENSLPLIDFPVSEVVAETAAGFRTLAQSQGKTLSVNVQPMLTMRGNDRAIEQLVSLLMDNALKYSPAGSTVRLDLTRQGRALTLSVLNETQTPVPTESLHRIFDRFYRADPSRNSETGGHGIGLSVAKAIVTALGGKLSACAPDERSFRISATLPIS